MPTSSSTYSARIIPDRALRACVFGVMATCGLAGVWVIAGLPWSPVVRMLGVAWAASLVADGFRLGRGYSDARSYVVRADGDADVISPDGPACRARLAAGTTVYAGFAWLRFERPGGGSWGELVRRPSDDGKHLKNKDWRRLQVICRHLSACYHR